MSSKQIKILPSVSPLGAMKLPTGGFGDVSVTVNELSDYFIGNMKKDISYIYSTAGGMISRPTLADLQTIRPTLDNQLGLVEATGDLYRWDGTSWVATNINYNNQVKQLITHRNIEYPLIPLGIRNGVNVNKTGYNNILFNVILNAKILRANKDYFYRIMYLGISNKTVENDTESYTVTIQMDALKRKNYESTDTREFILSKTVNIKRNQGDKLIRIPVISDGYGHGAILEILIDSDKLDTYKGQFFSGWRPDHTYYCWIIDPENYEYQSNDIRSIYAPTSWYGTNPPTSYSTRYYTDPTEEMQIMLSGGGKRNRSQQNMNNTVEATTWFKFPSYLSTMGTMVSFGKYDNLFQIPIAEMSTQTDHSFTAFKVFTGDVITPHGWERFTARTIVPTNAFISGYLSFLIRVPDETTRESYSLVLQNAGNLVPFNAGDREWVGFSYPFEANQPITNLSKKDLGTWNFYTDEEYDQWLSGTWLKVDMPISGNVSLYPTCSYRFRLYRTLVSGTPLPEGFVRNEDLIILRGECQFRHTITSVINSEYEQLGWN